MKATLLLTIALLTGCMAGCSSWWLTGVEVPPPCVTTAWTTMHETGLEVSITIDSTTYAPVGCAPTATVSGIS